MKLHFPDGKGGINTIEVSDNISLYIENLLEDWTLETASESVKGGIKVGDGLYMTGDSLNAKQYTLFPASKDSLGGVKIGDGLSINSEGVISTDVYELPIATAENLGGVIIGNGLTIDSAGVVSTEAYTLPTASETVKGGIMVGTGLYMDGDSLNASVSGGGDTYYVVEGGEGVVSLQPVYIENPYELPIANKTRLGGIKVGSGLEINSVSGVLSAKTEELPIATRGSLGVIIVGNGLEVDKDGVVDVELPIASRTKLGAIKVGEGLDMVGETLTVTITPENNYYYTLDGGEGLVTLQPVLIENPYILPPATRESLGGVIIGNGLTIDSGGVVSAATYTLPTASYLTKGGVKIGNGLTMVGESLNADGYDLPTASKITKGGIKVGNGLYMTGDSLNASSSSPVTYTLPTANETVKGGIKVGKGLYMNGDSLNAGFDSLSPTDEIIEAIINKTVEQSSSMALSVNVNKISPPGSIPPNYADEIPPLTFAIPNREPPYCAEYEVSDWAGGGLLILSAEWYYKDFKIFGDDDEEIFTTNEQTYATGWFPGDSNPPRVQIQDDEHVHVDESNIIESGINISQTKKLINGQTIIRITHYTFRHHLQQKMITAKWHSEEQTSFVTFSGSVHEELPLTAIRGSVIYKINDEKCYLYDGEKWLPL